MDFGAILALNIGRSEFVAKSLIDGGRIANSEPSPDAMHGFGDAPRP